MLTLFLMTEKGYRFLVETTAKYGSLFDLVVVGSDSSLRKDHADEIIAFCAGHQLRWVRRADFGKVETPYALAVSWRWLIEHPAQRLIVFHDSLLPRYRGFSPLVNALINGESEVGVSAIFGASDFDTGPIIAQSRTAVRYPLRIADAIQAINANYLACAETVLQALLDGAPLEATPQDERQATYSVWRDEQDYRIDWSKSSTEIRRFIDAVGYPYRGAATMFDGKLIRILAAEEAPDVVVENRDCGKALFVVDGKPVIICGEGMLKVTEAQIEEGGQLLPFFPQTRFRIRFTGGSRETGS